MRMLFLTIGLAAIIGCSSPPPPEPTELKAGEWVQIKSGGQAGPTQWLVEKVNSDGTVEVIRERVWSSGFDREVFRVECLERSFSGSPILVRNQ